MMTHEHYNTTSQYLLWVFDVIIHELQIPSVGALSRGDAGVESLFQLGIHGGEYLMVFGLERELNISITN